MDVADSLADLAEISPQLISAVLLDPRGDVVGSHPASRARAEGLAETARQLVAHAEHLSPGRSPVKELEVATRTGSVLVVRERGWTIAATTTRRAAPVPLLRADLRSCVDRLAEAAEAATAAAPAAEAKPKRARARSAAKKTPEESPPTEALPEPERKPKRTRKSTTAKAATPKKAAAGETTAEANGDEAREGRG
ncbi:MAG: hypothetical protein M3M94_06875 [Actinomycetota bacterium]|nr:hypothetical protein [Actinomycetota bacterium]